ncbi:DUF4259 domain-containing protein [Clostridium sp. D33t1_170424_F3]|uniref:DUF4259 domain-containing protein n=1 Tax=Clostridium sp. D33t1_170424_F3 TaxID=2787099 RepID=UPI0018AB9747|nr:DUF4259 domain-containing protein [Clostridium sp. D33t1_170424_F3]
MGAWNYAVFDDDTAYDALDDIMASSNIIADMEWYFDAVIHAEYVDYDEGHYALVSAAVIDSAINGTHHRCDVDHYFKWTESLTHLDFSSLKQKAIKAIDAVLSNNSELKELWEENEELYPLWRKDKRSIQEKLR